MTMMGARERRGCDVDGYDDDDDGDDDDDRDGDDDIVDDDGDYDGVMRMMAVMMMASPSSL